MQFRLTFSFRASNVQYLCPKILPLNSKLHITGILRDDSLKLCLKLQSNNDTSPDHFRD